MSKTLFAVLATALAPFCAFAVDGVTLINQSTVMTAGGFPYKIQSSGSYKLSGNLVVSTADNAIQINSDDVVLDLNGFKISGPIVCVGSPPTCTGTSVTGVAAYNRQNVTVKNGIIRGFKRGIELGGTASSGGLIADLQSSGNSEYGIYGVEAVIVRCSANNNGEFGIGVVNGTVSDSLANRNKADGFSPFAATLIHNAGNLNGSYGVGGFGAPFLFGSNVFLNNTTGDVTGGTSQNNNLCTSGTC